MTPSSRTVTQVSEGRVRSDGERCDKCRKRITGGDVAFYRTDGAVFCDKRCAEPEPITDRRVRAELL
jgi:hypothetical protein